jgi:hypothetical protein
MTKRSQILVLAGMVLVVVAPGLSAAGEPQAANPSDLFAVATVHLEPNATDGDFEVVFEVKGGADGLTKLTVVSPDGRTIVDIAAPDTSTLGVRQLRFESPEPRDFKKAEIRVSGGCVDVRGSGRCGHQTPRQVHSEPHVASFGLRPSARGRRSERAGQESEDHVDQLQSCNLC